MLRPYAQKCTWMGVTDSFKERRYGVSMSGHSTGKLLGEVRSSLGA